ncbi:hypothetical protein ACFY71_13765 [Streptomyces cinerochromogenes]|uniref:Uncharacterized protein n=1 Tax=Streptomyces cinerochromogenes TaxID=66422 RepID=A0ABW7AZS2_9ACTN
MRLYRAGARGAAAAARMRAGRTARRVLVAEAAVVGGLALALFVREIPGIRREVRIWRMINLRSGAKRPR